MKWLPQFSSFTSRILFYILCPLIIVQSATLFAIDFTNDQNAQTQISEDLAVAARVFDTLIENRQQRLIQAARLLAGDFAFKTAFSSQDAATIRSALRNHQTRINADAIMLFDLDGELIAAANNHNSIEESNRLADLIRLASDQDDDELAAMVPLSGALHQWIAVPLLAPLPVAWIAIGFRLDDELTKNLMDLTLAQVTILEIRGDSPIIHASTLVESLQTTLLSTLPKNKWSINETFLAQLGDDNFIILLTNLGGNHPKDLNQIVAVLQRPLEAVLAPYHRLRLTLLILLVAVLIFSPLIARPVVNSVTKPVRQLAAAANRIRKGDYGDQVTISQTDEIGELSIAFNDMTKGLAERDQVRDLLGKVVDPNVAEELLNNKVELGGEERNITIMFADIRGFTSLSERLSPQQLVSQLNEYLTQISSVIEVEGGIIDKYIGDAVMALFGAPKAHDDDPARAVRASLAMGRALNKLNRKFIERDLPTLGIGIGINTATVVTGNMGSETRLNYTAIGDGVNLTARIEGLTRVYEVPVIVCENTKNAVQDFHFLELDRVRVKGKNEIERIFTPITDKSNSNNLIKRHEVAIAAYRKRQWDIAKNIFDELRGEFVDFSTIYDIYIQRIAEYRITPPPANWDAVITYEKK